MTKGLNKLTKEIHQNAVDHGWWEEERSTGEILALCHSELSEALEEFRNGMDLKTIYANYDGAKIGYSSEYTKDAKPEGIPVELADVVIRILDFLGKRKTNINAMLEDDLLRIERDNNTFGEFISICHCYLSMALINDVQQDQFLIGLIVEIFKFSENFNIDIQKAIEIKHEYNKTRPYKHGGKVI